MKNINIRCWIALLLISVVSFSSLLSVPSSAEESDDFSIGEIIEDVDLDAAVYDSVPWSFPVALEDMNPEYIILANKHYLLDKSYVPDDLVKVPKDPAKGGIKWAVSGSDGKLKGQYLRAECAQALCDMNAAMMEQDGFRTMYLKSAYRSYSKQNTMYKNRLAKHNGKDDGWVSMAGASDHQTGLGCDVVPSNWKDRGMNDKMMKEPECQWMAAHCHEYGFIIRGICAMSESRPLPTSRKTACALRNSPCSCRKPFSLFWMPAVTRSWSKPLYRNRTRKK